MIKRRYNEQTGKLGASYPEYMTIPEPFLLLSEEDNDNISSDAENIYFFIDGNLITKNKKEEEARINKLADIDLQLDELDKKCIRALREGGNNEDGIPYINFYQQQIEELRNKRKQYEE